jgi:hypothetical protein
MGTKNDDYLWYAKFYSSDCFMIMGYNILNIIYCCLIFYIWSCTKYQIYKSLIQILTIKLTKSAFPYIF